MSSRGLSFLLPAYNEEKALGYVIDEIRDIWGLGTDIWVVDNNSKDSTFRLAFLKGANLIKEYKQGKGYAVASGRLWVDTPYVVMVDSDYTYPIIDTLQVLSKLKEGYDVVLGCRYLKVKGSMSWLNHLGNKGLSLIASKLYGKPVGDVCSGLWGFKSEVLRDLEVKSSGFTLEVDLWINIVKGGYKTCEVPVEYLPRLTGDKAKLRAQTGLKIGWFLLKERWMH